MSVTQFGQHWIGKVMRADCTTSPRLFSSNQAAMDLVRSMPGAIAIVNAAQVSSGIKVLAIEGKLPRQAGYKLQITECALRILGIESSCDETAAAVVEDGDRVLSSVGAAQLDTHGR